MSRPLVEVPARWPRVRFTFASLGWRRAVVEVATGRRAYEPRTDRSFDDLHGTDTAGSVEPEQLGIVDDSRRESAILYLPSPTRVTSWMLDNAGVDPTEVTFVDLGCGKGRVVLVAAERPFRRIVGVEISTDLAAIARRNVERYRPPSGHVAAIEIVNADATSFDLPETDLLLHLYHPFQPEITATVLRRLEASLAVAPRRVVVAYLAYTAAVEPVAVMLSEFPWLHRTRYEQSVRGHYNWLLYST